MATINHGTVRGYKSGCRCDLCRKANTDAKRLERERRDEREGKRPAARSTRKRTVPTTPSASPQEPEHGPIEAAFREAFSDETDSALTRARREVIFAAARVMDTPKHAPYFKSAAAVARETVADLLEAAPPKDGEGDALAAVMATFRGSRGSRPSRGRAAEVDDSEEPE
ncbi:hypothetical protein [Microcella pacifica]|uniref:Uncharacterized protein n=1 Tax=Microcella pacifica TaxID=2591847 RepID=A0A9E5JMA0_9MICO|nr:hypothetical protein [Microcella pacifica]NHF62244.1 hypothetical protein [Microcella pacifica]